MADVAVNPRRGWRIYAWLMAVLLVIFLAEALINRSKEPLWDAVDYLVSGFTLIGVFGYAYSRRIWSQAIWRIALPIAVFWEISNTLRALAKGDMGNVAEALLSVALVVVIVVPAYIAVYRYGYRSPELWANKI